MQIKWQEATSLIPLLLLGLCSFTFSAQAAATIPGVIFENDPPAKTTVLLPSASTPAPTKPATPGATGATSPGAATGQTSTQSGSPTGLQNPLQAGTLEELLTAILKGVVAIGAIFLTFMIIYVGFLFVAARGNEEKIRDARQALVWTVIGGLLLLGAEAISLVIQSTAQTL
ncbi:MAG: hypothetical protein AAB472_01450 [Patescibacteria group bacterium]